MFLILVSFCREPSLLVIRAPRWRPSANVQIILTKQIISYVIVVNNRTVVRIELLLAITEPANSECE